MSKELIRQLKALKHESVKPDEFWLKKNRELLLSQIKNTVSDQDVSRFNVENFWRGLSVFLPQSVVYKVLRPAMALVLVVAMFVGSWAATVSASSESLPGEWLYSVKRAAEKTQVALTAAVGDKNKVVTLHGELAKKRVVEISKLVIQNDPDKIEKASRAVGDLKDEIKIVSAKLEEIKTTPNSGAEGVKNINQNVKEIKDVLDGVKDNLLVSNDVASATDLSDQVSEVNNLVKNTAVKTVEIMVEKHLQDGSVSKDEVKQAISDELNAAVNSAVQSSQSVIEVNKVVAVVKDETNAVVKAVVNSASAEAGQVIASKIEATSKQTQAAVNTTQALTDEAGKTASEGQTLLSQDNLVQALDKVKAASQAVTSIEQITDTAIKAVQTILPVAAAVTDPAVSAIIMSTTTSSTAPSVLATSTTNTAIQLNGSTTSVIILKSTTTPSSTISSTIKK